MWKGLESLANKKLSPNRFNGILVKVRPSKDNGETARRVELFAKVSEKVFGILHTFFIAYSSEKLLLEMAETSSDVVQVRTINSNDTSAGIVQDHLILKRICLGSELKTDNAFDYHASVPDVIVPAVWGERMKLKTGDKVVIYRPTGEYSMPPPVISDSELI